MDFLRVNRDLLIDRLAESGLGHVVIRPDATYLGWLDLSEFSLDDPADFLREQAQVATTAGVEHGAAGAGFVRINFATPRAVLEDALDRMVRELVGSPAERVVVP